jgi:hypothetical protein
MILDLPDRTALEEHLRGDPFFSADLFESVTVWSTRQVLPERKPGALDREIAAACIPAVPASTTVEAILAAPAAAAAAESLPLTSAPLRPTLGRLVVMSGGPD